ncbi:ABC transporter permease, partial [Candidatus Calescamantes bacterium]|nr:ABC transporter permease [Candidatus Calescamantes bacterium]
MNYLIFLTIKSLKGKRDSFAHFSTLVSILGVSVGVAAVIIVMGVMSGFDEELQNKILSFKPHISIISWSTFTYPVKWEKEIHSPQISSIYPVVWGEGILKTLKEPPLSKGVVIKGVPWDKLPALKIKLEYKGRGIILGKELTRRLGIKNGEKIFLLTPHLEGEVFPVVGTVETGIYQFDSSLVILPFPQAQHLLGMEGVTSRMEIKVKNPGKVEEIKKYLEEIVPADYEVLTWKETEKTFFSALRMEKLTMFTILSLILIVAALGITASLILKVMEKKKDVGI